MENKRIAPPAQGGADESQTLTDQKPHAVIYLGGSSSTPSAQGFFFWSAGMSSNDVPRSGSNGRQRQTSTDYKPRVFLQVPRLNGSHGKTDPFV